MGILYQDDISKENLAKEDAFEIEATKFSKSMEGKSRLQKSKKFYVSMSSLQKIFGDRDYGWTVLEKNSETGKWEKVPQ